MRITLNEMRTTLFPLVWIFFRFARRRDGPPSPSARCGTPGYFFLLPGMCASTPSRDATSGDRPSSIDGWRARRDDDDASSGGTIDVCARRAGGVGRERGSRGGVGVGVGVGNGNGNGRVRASSSTTSSSSASRSIGRDVFVFVDGERVGTRESRVRVGDAVVRDHRSRVRRPGGRGGRRGSARGDRFGRTRI